MQFHIILSQEHPGPKQRGVHISLILQLFITNHSKDITIKDKRFGRRLKYAIISLKFPHGETSMQLLHIHWRPPTSPVESGEVVLWAENGLLPPPKKQRGRPSQKPKAHPFDDIPASLERLLKATGLAEAATNTTDLTLLLPTGKYGPRPSPQLQHDWEVSDDDGAPRLAPWQITGIALSPQQGFTFLTHLPDRENLPPGLVLGLDAQYWQTVCSLVLETLAQQKILPTMAPADLEGKTFHARWLPVLDGPHDGPRLAQLQATMPPLCRAEAKTPEEAPHPRHLLESFLNTLTDTLARDWGQPKQPGLSARKDDTARHWLNALFHPSPGISGSPAQLDYLHRSYRAWLRNLHLAGDRTSRVAFRLAAPAQQSVSRKEKAWQLHFALQARDDPSLLVSAEQIWQTKGKVLKTLNRRFEQPQEKLLTGLGYAARLFEPLQSTLQAAKPNSLALSTQEAFDFLRDVAPLLEGSGFGVLVPPWWNQPGTRLGVRLKMSTSPQPSADVVPKSNLTFENLVRYKWELSLGDTPLTREEFEALVALKSPLVQIRGQWVQLDPDQIEAAIRFWEKQELEADIGWQETLRLGLGATDSIDGLPVQGVEYEGWLADWMERFKGDQKLEVLPQPDGLQGTLRPYQQYGYSWLDFMRRWQMGACLADDMGLGKTIQTLALLQREKEEAGRLPGPVLLVCPTSVVSNWAREVHRFAPGLTTLQHQGPDRLREEDFINEAGETDLVLTSYAVVRRDIEAMQAVDWFGVVLDEAQNIKNPGTKQARAVRSLSPQFRLALTGTPVENRLSELWSIMQFLNPGYLGSRQDFRATFALPIERYQDEAATARLRQMTGPFILRRVKTDPTVIQDLPEKNEMKIYCNLSEEQATLYESVVQNALAAVEQAEDDGIQRKGLVLSMLMQLKQVCNHPAQFLHQVGNGQTAEPEAEMHRSGKLARLTEMLDESISVGDRSLIFTQFSEMGHFLKEHLQQTLGVPSLFLHGGTPAKKRAPMVQRFQEDANGPPIFILSLKAGGTGLNLTRANHVFHFDRWWNPAVEDQATDRAFRIGQTRNVQVHKFVCVGTLEEMIDEMIESKKALAESVVGQGENWLTELSTGQLRELVSLRREVL
jgi:SNF2 family DNA or RNA helicase